MPSTRPTEEPAKSEANACSAVDAIYSLVTAPSVHELMSVREIALYDKYKLFQKAGWGPLNHPISEGDVRCVLNAIVEVAKERQRSDR